MNLKNIRGFDQIAFWLFMFLFVADYHFFDDDWGRAIEVTTLEILTFATVSYVNLFILMPLFFGKKKYFLFGIGAVLTVVLMIIITRGTGLECHLYDAEGFRNIVSMMLNYSLFFLLSSLYWYYKDRQKQLQRQLTLKNEKLEAELKFLKTQISPHFLFNTLNNIYALAYQKHDNAAPMVAKLSKIMRYIIYDGNVETVPLEKEIETLRSYIDLHLMRKPRSENIDFYAEGNFKNHQIAPLLLINFVENCFKHSDIDKNEDSFIKIVCQIIGENELHFSTENSFEPNSKNKDWGGIGLENVRRQLALNYEVHDLKIYSKNNIFKLELSLKLQM